MNYPKYDNMTVTIFDRHLEWLNRRFCKTGITRSAQVREALELLIAKVAGGVASKSPRTGGDDDAIAPRTDGEFVDQVTPESGGGEAGCGRPANAEKRSAV